MKRVSKFNLTAVIVIFSLIFPLAYFAYFHFEENSKEEVAALRSELKEISSNHAKIKDAFEALSSRMNVLNEFIENEFPEDNNFTINPKFDAHGHDYSQVILNKLKSLRSISKKLFYDDTGFSSKATLMPVDLDYVSGLFSFKQALPDKSFGINVQGSAYIDIFSDRIVVASADGDFYIGELIQDSIDFRSIKSNIHNQVSYPEFYEDSMYGIKDILILDNRIYVSLINETRSKNCWGIIVLASEFSIEGPLDFEQIYQPRSCVGKQLRAGFWPHLSGGKIAVIDSDTIALSVGTLAFMSDYYEQNRYWPDDSVEFGKIVQIDLRDFSSSIISRGHRNPQGLFYSKDKDLIISTEHGPDGGDELNFIRLNDDTQDFGWPEASYGYSYGRKEGEADIFLKSHKEHGFVEPEFHWSPSIGISATEECSLSGKNQIFVGSMGALRFSKSGLKESRSIIVFDETEDAFEKSKIIGMNGRIRDLVCDEKRNTIWFWDETQKGLGYLRAK